MKFNAVLLCVLLSFTIFMGAYFPVPLTSNTVPGLVTKTLPAVVELRPGFARWLGAGVLISEDGWVLTAGHVVRGQDVMIATMRDGTKHMSINIIADPNSDIAILKIDIKDAPCVKMNRAYPLLGEPVFVIGHPLGMFYSISLGIVSNAHIDKPPWGSDLIVTDAEVTHGNSGGPLFDMEGRLLGIVVAGSHYFTGLEQNFIVPVARGRELLEKYVRQKEITADPNSLDVPDLQPCG
jgi:S1-C subfamily serine protease